jgi:hypothetical protein
MGIFPSGYKFLTGNVLALSIVSILADLSTLGTAYALLVLLHNTMALAFPKYPFW